jgi:GTPase SAR1 family protein
MHDELRLSVALQMVPEVGVGGLINYSGFIDKYTRIICYNYYGYTEYISDDEFKSLTRNKMPMPNISATHVIVLVNWGVCAVAILQLPRDEDINKIDQALENLCASLSNDRATAVLPEGDKHLLEKIVHTEVFSSIPDLAKIKSIIDFHREIPQIKTNPDLFKPYNYNLCSVQSFYITSNSSGGKFMELQEQDRSEIEDYLLQLSSCLKRSRTAMERNYSNLQQKLKNQLSEMRTKWSNLEQMYMHEIQRLHEIVIGVRRGEIDREMISKALNNNKKEDMIKSIDSFEYDLIILQEKEQLIDDLLEKQFDYRDASEYSIENGDDQQMIERKLLNDGKFDRVIVFNNISRNENKSEWDDLITQLINQCEENPQLRFTYADLSCCSHKPNYFVILSKNEKNNNISAPQPVVTLPPSTRPKSDGAINILLLGESGVGKSTFINALANYLAFNTFEQAQTNPIVLIPVFFIMTVGDDFKECRVKFSREDDLYNEDYEHTGQSVTQHCKSYVFTLQDGDSRERKLRIIDTPGIGDVRGVAQDDINMQHILLYMTNLTHLNAVCILMKPNNARLNIFFRSCFTQLFDLLGENARDKIIFCFTNARATFYTPGDTGPLLKQLLTSLPVKGIPFEKTNTFCFDSESFRYLVAIRNRIPFSEPEQKDYKDSWEKSSTESKRFLQCIRTKTTSPLVPGESKSMKDAQLKITVLIRPILESMRNILRNIVFWNNRSRTKSIELRPRTIKDSTGICLTCTRQYVEIDGFWITRDRLHFFHNNCRTCDCSPSDHYSIDYQLEYRLCDRPESHSDKEMTKMVDDLCKASAEFGYFLVQETDSPQNDLFLAGMKRMVKEENDICGSKGSCELNADLVSHLEQLKRNYEEMRKERLAGKQRIELSKIYDRIEVVSKHEMMKSQMAAAKEWHKFMIKHYEDDVLV